MNIPNKEILENLRAAFPEGTRVELVEMNDKQAPPIGTRGTVKGVDDIASLMVSWDNGSSLHVLYGTDRVRKLDSVKITCYGQTQIWDAREDAIAFYAAGVEACDGSEKARYAMILAQLVSGEMECCDE